jgi:hypothetical protein
LAVLGLTELLSQPVINLDVHPFRVSFKIYPIRRESREKKAMQAIFLLDNVIALLVFNSSMYFCSLLPKDVAARTVF